MSLSKVSFFSKALESTVEILVYMPSKHNFMMLFDEYEEIYKRKEYKVLYLLHGALDDATAWIRGTQIERLAEKYGIAVVMPSGQNSFYVDAKNGLAYHTYLTRELPLFIESIYNVSKKSEDRFIAGLSMGGYGALYSALMKPNLYSAVGSFSGVVDIVSNVNASKEKSTFKSVNFEMLFGDLATIKDSNYNLFNLATKVTNEKNKLKMFLSCGTEDMLYNMHQSFSKHLIEIKANVHIEEETGTHDWLYWNKAIEHFLTWLHNEMLI